MTNDNDHPITFIPIEVLRKALKMPFKREVKFALAAWSFAPANGEIRLIQRNMVLKFAGMHLSDGEFRSTIKACQKHQIMPENLKIQ